jgi:DNA polymerase-3 subunit gamma/tau
MSGEEGWPAILAALDLQGFARQLAANCTLTGREGGVFSLALDARCAHHRTAQNEANLRESLSRLFGMPVTLRIEIADALGEAAETPARQQARVTDERQQAARAALAVDPAVKSFQDTFGASIVPESVKPLS